MVDTLVLGTSALRVRVRVPPTVHNEGGKSKTLYAGLAVTDNNTDGCHHKGNPQKHGPVAQLDRATAF